MKELVLARPLTVGEIFDRAVTIAVRRWRAVAVFALLASLPDIVEKLVLRERHESDTALGAIILFDIVVNAFTATALVRVLGDPTVPDDIGVLLRGAVREYPRALASSVLTGAIFFPALGIAVLIVALAVSSAAGNAGRVVTFVAGAALALPLFAALAPLYLITTIAFATTILEGLGPWRGVATAFARCRSGGFARMWLLGAAWLCTIVASTVVVDEALDQVSRVTGYWWLMVLAYPFESLWSLGFGLSLAAVTAVDYRNRSEGTDLAAQLDAVAAS